MGHVDSTVRETIYGRLSRDDLLVGGRGCEHFANALNVVADGAQMLGRTRRDDVIYPSGENTP